MPAVPESQAGKLHSNGLIKIFVRQLAYGKKRREIVSRFIEPRAQVRRRYFYHQTILDRVVGFLSNLDMHIAVVFSRAGASHPTHYRKCFRLLTFARLAP